MYFIVVCIVYCDMWIYICIVCLDLDSVLWPMDPHMYFVFRFVKCIANYGFAYVPYENIIRLVHCTVYVCTVHYIFTYVLYDYVLNMQNKCTACLGLFNVLWRMDQHMFCIFRFVQCIVFYESTYVLYI